MRPFGSHKVYLSIPLLSTREEILPKMQDSDTYLLSSQLEIKYDVNSTIERSFQMDPQFENIAVLTDTEADIPAEILAGENLIYTLPLRINDGTHDYRDGVDISVDEIYRRQPEEDFKTSQPVVEDILEMLKKIRADGFSKVICLILSEGLSGAI